VLSLALTSASTCSTKLVPARSRITRNVSARSSSFSFSTISCRSQRNCRTCSATGNFWNSMPVKNSISISRRCFAARTRNSSSLRWPSCQLKRRVTRQGRVASQSGSRMSFLWCGKARDPPCLQTSGSRNLRCLDVGSQSGSAPIVEVSASWPHLRARDSS